MSSFDIQHFFSRYAGIVCSLLAGLAILPVPLLGEFHLESAMLASTAGCFWAGWIARSQFKRNKLTQVYQGIYLFGLPLFVYAIINNCFSLDGVLFWIFLPIPSVLFGYSIGRFFHKLPVPKPRLFSVLILLVVAFGTLVVEFFGLPQVYFFNHVWGYWPGPVYDETVLFTSSLLYYRFITFGWILLLWFLPSVLKNRLSKWAVIAAVGVLIFSYLWLPQNGIISPRYYIQQQLGGEKQTEHFTLYYAEQHYTDDEIERVALEHEFYFSEIVADLSLAPSAYDRKIESYLYAHPWQKKDLVGAKFTSYVPVWLEQDQLHIAKPQVEATLKHELVHVLAKQFGNRILNASWSIGLVEGLATALAPKRAEQSTLDQIVVSESPLPTTDEMKQFFAPLGFYGGRSTVNYTTSGSFVDFLLKNYSVDHFKESYRRGDISSGYSKPMEELVEEWHIHLDTVAIDSLDQQIAARLFSMPSLFEQECPRLHTNFEKAWDQYLFFRAEGDTTHALEHLDIAVSYRPDNLRLKSEWAYEQLRGDNIEKVVTVTDINEPDINLQLLYADALALAGSMDQARNHVEKAAALAAFSGTALFEGAIALRLHQEQWQKYRSVTYDSEDVSEQEFATLFYRTKMRALQRALEQEKWERLSAYGSLLTEDPVELKYFDEYIELVHQLVFLEKWQLAETWIRQLESRELRPRYRQRLDEEKAWLNFCKNPNIEQ